MSTLPAVYNLGRLVGRCVGVMRKTGNGRWWVTVGRVQRTDLGLRLWVYAGHGFGNPRWVDARKVKTRANRDQAIIDRAAGTPS